MADCVNVLKEWTGKTSAKIVYDSTVDEFTHDGLFEKVQGKQNIALVGFTTEGDVFGGFYNVAVTGPGQHCYDQDLFVFSFESHGRCMTPQRFLVWERLKKKAYVSFWKNDIQGFVYIGVFGAGAFILGNEKSNSYCAVLSCAFEGLQNTTLTGQNGDYFQGPYHHCARLVAVQLE